MRAVLIAVVIGLVRLGVGAQEECPNTQLLGAEAEINHGDLGLLLLQVSKAAATAVTTASEIRGKLVAAPVSHRHKNAAESNAEKGQVAAPSSEQVGHHHDVHHPCHHHDVHRLCHHHHGALHLYSLPHSCI